jgi:hypothetical protein
MLSAVAREMLFSMFDDLRMLSVYALVALVFVAGQRKYLTLRDNLGVSYEKSKWRQLEEAVLTGLVAGFIVSFISVLMGITIGKVAIEYFLLIIVLMAVINIRFIGFTYVGGVLVVVSALTGSRQIDSVSLLALMGLMQLTEALMTYLSGWTDAIPVYIKHGEKIAGAFVTRKVWPVPVVFFTYAFGEVLAMSRDAMTLDWRTLLKPETVIPGAAVLGFECLIAVAGYWDISISEGPKQRSKKTSLIMAGIAAFLLISVLIAHFVPIAALIAALTAIAIKEGFVIWGRKVQKLREPLFSSADRGLRLLDVMSGSNAEKIGLEKGDIILKVNGKDVQTIDGLKAALYEYPRYVWISVRKPDGSIKTYEKSFYPGGIDTLGILTVPRESEVTYNVDSYENLVILRNLVRRFRGIKDSMKG